MRRRYVIDPQKAKLPKPDGKHCVVCGKVLPKYKRKFCSDDCILKWRATILVKSWDDVRAFVMKRDNLTCQDCGRKEDINDPQTWLEVHHIVPIQDGGDEFDPENCITLCHRCHVARHKRLRTKTHPLKLWIED